MRSGGPIVTCGEKVIGTDLFEGQLTAQQGAQDKICPSRQGNG
jgi:hypothetical protein